MGRIRFSAQLFTGSQPRKLTDLILDPDLDLGGLRFKHLKPNACACSCCSPSTSTSKVSKSRSRSRSCSGFKSKIQTFPDSRRVLSDSLSSRMASKGIDMMKEIVLPFHCNSNARSDTDTKKMDVQQVSEAMQNAIDVSSQCLLNGGVLGVPTDTIYGIAGLAQNKEAVNRIYDIKQRNYEKPLAISVGTIEDIYRWSKVTVPDKLLKDLLPGPVTVVFERGSELNPTLNPNTSLVGIRIPDHIFMRDLAAKCASPIALTSANVSGDKSCLQIQEFQHLWPLLDLVVNGGKLNDSEESRLGSTVVDLSIEGTFRIIRPGSAHAVTYDVLHKAYQLKERTQSQ